MENERLTKRVTCHSLLVVQGQGKDQERTKKGREGREGRKKRWKDGANETIDMQNQTTWTQVIHWKK